MPEHSIKRLSKMARRGMRGHPAGTIAFYGPDDKRATKVAVGVILYDGAEPVMRSWFSETSDVRYDPAIVTGILAHLEVSEVKSISMVDRIFGCPHQEGIDYEGEYCPVCTFWAGRDRYTGKKVRQA
jgi:hypothetical protein